MRSNQGYLLDAAKDIIKDLNKKYDGESFLEHAYAFLKSAESYLTPQEIEELTKFTEKIIKKEKINENI